VISNFNTKNNKIKDANNENKKKPAFIKKSEIEKEDKQKPNSESEKGIIYNETDLYESEKVFFNDDNEEEENYKYYTKEVANEFNDSNKIELKNVSEIHQEKMKDISKIRILLKDLPLFSNLDFELDKFFEIVFFIYLFNIFFVNLA